MQIGELCSRHVVFAAETATPGQLARLMREHHAGCVVITREMAGVCKPVGIITDRDIVIELIAKDAPMESCTAGDIMTLELVTAKESDDVGDVFQSMRQHGVRRVPVVDDSGALVGIVSADDLVDYIREQISDLVTLIGREQRKEKSTRP